MAKDETGPVRPNDEEEEDDPPVSGGGEPVPESEKPTQDILEERFTEVEKALEDEHKEGAQYEDRSKDF